MLHCRLEYDIAYARACGGYFSCGTYQNVLQVGQHIHEVQAGGAYCAAVLSTLPLLVFMQAYAVFITVLLFIRTRPVQFHAITDQYDIFAGHVVTISFHIQIVGEMTAVRVQLIAQHGAAYAPVFFGVRCIIVGVRVGGEIEVLIAVVYHLALNVCDERRVEYKVDGYQLAVQQRRVALCALARAIALLTTIGITLGESKSAGTTTVAVCPIHIGFTSAVAAVARYSTGAITIRTRGLIARWGWCVIGCAVIWCAAGGIACITGCAAVTVIASGIVIAVLVKKKGSCLKCRVYFKVF